MDASWEATVKFHGHTCPGLAQGYRASMAAMAALGVQRADDEELVALVENDACGVDAVQFMTGCTIGKGNLVLLDYGKPGYTFYSRRRGSAVRIVVDGGMPPDPRSDELRQKARAGTASAGEQAEYQQLQDERIRRYLALPLNQGLKVQVVAMPEPLPARTFPSVTCEYCGERVMEPRARIQNGRITCLACHSEYAARWSK